MNIDDRIVSMLQSMVAEESRKGIKVEKLPPKFVFFKREIDKDVDYLHLMEMSDLDNVDMEDWNDVIFDTGQRLEKESIEHDGFVFTAIASTDENEEEDFFLMFIYDSKLNKKSFYVMDLELIEKKEIDPFLCFDIFDFKYGCLIN